MMTNRQLQEKNARATEKLVCKKFKEFGYWCFNIPKKVEGQPCDIVASKKNGKTFLVWLVDAKHVREEEVSFDFDRVEPNQITSMRYARDFAGLENLGFAIFFARLKSLYWLPFNFYEELIKQGAKSINMRFLTPFVEVLADADYNKE